MEFKHIGFDVGVNCSGVYQLVIDDKWLYIGSSGKLRNRMNIWRQRFKTNVKIPSKIKSVLSNDSVIEFRVVKKCIDVHESRVWEGNLIKEYWGTGTLLNTEIIPLSQSYKMKAVNQIDDNGNIVATYPFYKEAAKAVGCSDVLIHRCLKMKFRGQIKKYRAKGYFWEYA